MQNSWFECKVKYDKTLENGAVKSVTEPHLVEALNFTEAERRITEETAPYMMGEFEVTDIKRARYSEIFETTRESADKWFRAKLTFITLDEKSGKEKKQSYNYLAQASDLKDAVEQIELGMKGTMGDYQITSVAETMIINVYHYEQKPEFKQKIEE